MAIGCIWLFSEALTSNISFIQLLHWFLFCYLEHDPIEKKFEKDVYENQNQNKNNTEKYPKDMLIKNIWYDDWFT